MDYLLRVFDQGRDTGIECYIQLKGTSRLTGTVTHISFDFPVKSLRHYNETTKTAVLIVICDVKTGHCYFTDSREVADYSRRKKTIRLTIPRTKVVSDHELFLSAISFSQQRSINMHANDMQVVANNEEKRVEKLDGRVKCLVSYQNGKLNYQLGPKDGERLTFQISGDREKLQKLIEGGGNIHFGPGELKAAGSPLFDEAMKNGVVIKGRSVKMAGRLQLLDKSGSVIASIDPIDSELTGGTKSGSISGALPKDIFKFHFEIPDLFAVQGFTRHCDVTFQLGAWLGTDFKFLSYFDQLLRFMRSFKVASSSRIIFEREGNYVNEASLTMDFIAKPDLLLWHLEAIEKVRRIRDVLEVPIVYREQMTLEDIRSIEIIHGLLCTPNRPLPCDGHRVTCTITAEALRELERKGELYRPMEVSMPVELAQPLFMGNQLDLLARIKNSSLVLTKLLLHDSIGVRSFLSKAKDSEEINIVYVSQVDSVVTYHNEASKKAAS